MIELLVVVLIIGILAAVALPQYQTAVMKSRYLQAETMGRALHKAEKLYYMAAGEYTNKIMDLDITPPGGGTFNGAENDYSVGNVRCRLSLFYNELSCSSSAGSPDFFMYFSNENSRCRAYTEQQRKVCMSVSGSKEVKPFGSQSYVEYVY